MGERTAKKFGMPSKGIAVGVMSLAICACGSSGQGGATSYDLAHNAERSRIMTETSEVLSLYNFNVESTDQQRDRGAIQTFWRTGDGSDKNKSDSTQSAIRDRAFLHVSPRGKSSIQVNVYLMVNATLQFEIQKKKGDSWVDMTPTKEYLQQYRAIVRDIRNRMLGYQNEF